MLVNQLSNKFALSRNRRCLSNDIAILAIEDDVDDLYLIKRMLAQDANKNYILESTDILQAGLEILKTREFDIVLLDLGLSDTHGLDTLRTVLNQNITTPIIVLTGNNEQALGEEAIKQGAEDFIPKSEVTTTILSRSVSYAIERHTLLLQLQAQATTDTLTHLPNRRAAFERLDSLIEDGDRRSINFGIALLDLDGFKQINDAYGHLAGDEVLRQVAGRLKKCLRRSDTVARLGGDEFLIIVTHYHNSEEFLNVLNKKRNALLKPLTIYADHTIKNICVGTSIGACEWQAPLTSQQLVGIADNAMYASKRDRENSIFLYDMYKQEKQRLQNG